MNIFNLKKILSLTLLLGAVNGKSLTDYKNEIDELMKKTKNEIIEEKDLKNIILALDHPSLFLDRDYDFSKMGSIKKDELKKDKQYKFFHLNPKIKPDSLSDAIKAHDVSILKPDIQKELVEEVKAKSKFLRKVLGQVPVLKDIIAIKGDAADSTEIAIKRQVDKYIYDSLAFDGTRLSYTRLHKAVESLKGIFKVDRKAEDAVKAIKAALEKIDEKDILLITEDLIDPNVLDSFHLIPPKKSTDKPKTEEPKIINFLTIGIKASEMSTSSSTTLLWILVVSIVVASGALVYNGFMNGSSKKEGFEEDH